MSERAGTGRLAGKIAIVTGAAKGIGAATAELFREEGAVVIGVDVAPGRDSQVLALDVGDLDQWQSLVTRIIDQHSTIDVLVNNAGIVGSYAGIVDVELHDWDAVLRTNLTGTFFGMHAVIPVMQRAGRGSIVNVSSIWGTAAAAGVAPYQASKGAVRILSKNAAITYVADGIRVNSVHPDLILTPLIAGQDSTVTQQVLEATPMRRGAHPRELAYGVLFLACDESSFVTGTELVIDGGYLAV